MSSLLLRVSKFPVGSSARMRLGLGNQRPRDRDPLLLARRKAAPAGERCPLTEPELRQQSVGTRPLKRVSLHRRPSRSEAAWQRSPKAVNSGKKMMKLEDETDGLVPQPVCEPLRPERNTSRVPKNTGPRVRNVERARDRCIRVLFPDSGGTDDGDHLPLLDSDIDSAKHFHASLIGAVSSSEARRLESTQPHPKLRVTASTRAC